MFIAAGSKLTPKLNKEKSARLLDVLPFRSKENTLN